MNTYQEQQYHYTYLIINDDPIQSEKFYIGCHSSKVEPRLDTKYMGSSYHLIYDIKRQGNEHFTKEILGEWNSREEAMLHESRLHRDFNVDSDPEYYNRIKSRKGFTVNSVTK